MLRLSRPATVPTAIIVFGRKGATWFHAEDCVDGGGATMALALRVSSLAPEAEGCKLDARSTTAAF